MRLIDSRKLELYKALSAEWTDRNRITKRYSDAHTDLKSRVVKVGR